MESGREYGRCHDRRLHLREAIDGRNEAEELGADAELLPVKGEERDEEADSEHVEKDGSNDHSELPPVNRVNTGKIA